MGNKQGKAKSHKVGAEGGRAARPSLVPVPLRPGRRERRPSVSTHEEDVHAKYAVEQRELGHGHYGVVRKGVRREAGTMQDETPVAAGALFAIKTIVKAKVSNPAMLEEEVNIMRRVKHQNIIRMYEAYEDAHKLHLVMECCSGGELFDSIIARGHYSEADARALFRKLIDAVAYMHGQGIVHRDLKPENFLLSSQGDDAELKVIDFGLSKLGGGGADGTGTDTHMSTRVGTPYYMAPEILNGMPYDESCDIWSLGVILYILLCGYPPFFGDSDAQIFSMVRRGAVDFSGEEWRAVSGEAKDLITTMLNMRQGERPSAAELLEDKWLAQPAVAAAAAAAAAAGGGGGAGVHLGAALRRLRGFVQQNQLQKRAMAIIATQLTADEIQGLRKQFDDIDVDSSGSLSVEELTAAMSANGFHGVVQELFDSIDADGDETIDFPEFLSATMKRNTFLMEQRLLVAFNEFDIDGSGNLTMENLVDVMGSEQHAREVMRDVDTDKDGVISLEEFREMMRKSGAGALESGGSTTSFMSLMSGSPRAGASSSS